MKQVSILLLTILFTVASCKGQNNKNMEAQETPKSLIGKTITLEWTKGDKAIYEVVLLDETKVHWKAIEGYEKGQEATEKEYNLEKVSENIYLLSWLEAVGYTITVTLNFNDNTVVGIISNDKEWYPKTGVLTIK